MVRLLQTHPYAMFALTAAVSYLVSVLLHPNTDCSACRGSGVRRGAVFTRSSRPCRSCTGSGKTRRLGARFFTSRRR